MNDRIFNFLVNGQFFWSPVFVMILLSTADFKSLLRGCRRNIFEIIDVIFSCEFWLIILQEKSKFYHFSESFFVEFSNSSEGIYLWFATYILWTGRFSPPYQKPIKHCNIHLDFWNQSFKRYEFKNGIVIHQNQSRPKSSHSAISSINGCMNSIS